MTKMEGGRAGVGVGCIRARELQGAASGAEGKGSRKGGRRKKWELGEGGVDEREGGRRG